MKTISGKKEMNVENKKIISGKTVYLSEENIENLENIVLLG